MDTKQTVLITGGNGLLARALMLKLGATATIRALDAAFDGDLPPNVERIEGDIRDPETVRRALEGVNIVVHIAPLYPAESSLENDDDVMDQEEEDDYPLMTDTWKQEGDVLDQATRGTYVLLTVMQKMGITHLVLVSTLKLFDELSASYQVDERWRPRPHWIIEHLGPWLAELSAREIVRVAPIRAVCLRFGNLIEETPEGAWDDLALHLDDAVQGLVCGLEWVKRPEMIPAWRVFHITPAGPDAKIRLSNYAHQTLGYEPQHFSPPDKSLTTQEDGAFIFVRDEKPGLKPRRPIHKVVIFGAGGPVAAALAQELAASYMLRLTDARPLDEIAAENKPQSPGAPVAHLLPAPHENRIVDVRDPQAVLDACEGMDAIINCSVVRHDAVEAFRVNTLGAYNIMQAAVTHCIQRIVQTGPQMVDINEGIGYSWEYDVPGDAPPRPGTQLYFHSKYLGQEICRVFADNYGLEVPVLLYCMFYNPEVSTNIIDFSVSWQDSARAIRAALETPSLPSSYEVMNVLADLPHGRYSNARAKALLHWQPRDNFHRFWDRQDR